MKLKLTLGIILSALALGGVTANAHPIRHRHYHHYHSRHHFHHIHHIRYIHHIHHIHHIRHIHHIHHIHHIRHIHHSHYVLPRTAPRSRALRRLVARVAAANGVPYRLANAVVTIESRYNPHVSNGRALGLMQIKAQTARGLGFHGAAKRLFDPKVNVRYGMAYLALAYRLSHGDLCATVMRYQSGIGARHMSAANRAYCRRAHALIAGA